MYFAMLILALAASVTDAAEQLYAAPAFLNDYSNRTFCVDLQREVNGLTAEEKSGDWLSLIKNKDIRLLKWSDIDPDKSMASIEENDVQIQMEAPFINASNSKQFHFSIDEMWRRFALPFYRVAIALKSMRVQEAEFDFSSKGLTIVRYAVNQNSMAIRSRWSNSDFTQYYWMNFIAIKANNNQETEEYPISIPGYANFGEVFVVDGKLSLLTSSATGLFDVDEIILPSSGVANLILVPSLKHLILSPACPPLEVSK